VVLADLVSGLVHWIADTWGSESLPVVGRRFLRPFRVHHTNPDDFLRRNFLDTNGDVAMLCLPVLLAGFLIPLDTGPGRLAAVALVAFCAGVLPTNQVHQWAHMPNPPGWVGWLQRRGLLLSHAQHQRHHVAPFAVNYCISTGWCNRPLTTVGFFPALEWVVGRLTGLTPRGEDLAFSARFHPAAEQP
jgi:ubiquitin-conjugating enzyme E2 variant